MLRPLCLLLALGICALAQTPLATVTGLATDPSGSAIVSSSIALTNNDTGVKLSTKSNESGAWSFPNLAPGSYSLTAEAAGFSKINVEPFALGAFQTLRKDLHFQVASVATDVTISAGPATVIQVDTPSIS